MRRAIGIIILILSTGWWLVKPVAAQEPEFEIDTSAGITAFTQPAPKEEIVMSPTFPLVAFLHKLVTMLAVVATTNSQGQSVIQFPDLTKQAEKTTNALPALLPAGLQPRVERPQDKELTPENKLVPQIGGRACSAKSEQDKNRPLGTMIVGDAAPKDYYDTLTSGTLISGIFGTIQKQDNEGNYVGNGLPGLKLTTPKQNFFRPEGEQYLLADSSVLQECGSQTTGEKIDQKEAVVHGTIATANQPALNVAISEPHYDSETRQKISLLQYLLAAGACLKDPGRCFAVYQSLGTSLTYSVILPGAQAQNALVNGGLLMKDGTTAYKGWVNTFKPNNVKFVSETTGTTDQKFSVRVMASPENETQTTGSLPWSGVKGATEAIDKATECMLLPKSLQTADCQVQITQGCAPHHPADFTLDANIQKAIQEGSKGKIPACVLEGVKFIETGPSWNPGPTCKINACGAAGPFQISVGVDGNGDPHCKQCSPSYADGSKKCNQEWASYGWPGNPNAPSPCNVPLATQRIIEILQNKAKYWTKVIFGKEQEMKDGVSVQNQRNAIILAGNHYYGLDAPISRLGNCSYGEFVYQRCDPCYICGTGNILSPF